jgi:hypothetical protein
LKAALESEQAKNPVLGPFVSHEEVQSPRHPYLAHFQDDDPDVIWRFTSEPLDEKLFIDAGSDLEEIMRVTAKHSGGNDKSNERIKTLSFGRNRGALLGTAASIGGDKNVLDIIHSAEYLYGVKISGLAGKGISAHPALYRTISMFETEYVLVRSPGLPAVSLHDIASIRHANPLKGRIAKAEGFEERYQPRLKPKTPNIVQPNELEPVPPGVVDWLLSYGRAAMQAADAFKGMIQDKEHKPEGIALPRALIGYIGRIDAALGLGDQRTAALEAWLTKVERQIAQAASEMSQRELRSPVPSRGAPPRSGNLPPRGRGTPPTPGRKPGPPVVKK